MAKSRKHGEVPADYAVGWGKPPKHSRFKPGQSGNPGGRKKGSVNVKTAVRQALESHVELTENGQKRSVSLLDALVLNLAQQALRGNVKAIQVTLSLAEQYCDADNDDREELQEEDLAILRRVTGARRSLSKGSKARSNRHGRGGSVDFEGAVDGRDEGEDNA
jgi:hypothetical protein